MEGFIRPKAVVLSDDSLVPKKNIISPPPNQFTHEVLRPQPYFFGKARTKPDGVFPAGTKVVLLVFDRSKYSRVADGRGLYVDIEHDSLRRLAAHRQQKEC